MALALGFGCSRALNDDKKPDASAIADAGAGGNAPLPGSCPAVGVGGVVPVNLGFTKAWASTADGYVLLHNAGPGGKNLEYTLLERDGKQHSKHELWPLAGIADDKIQLAVRDDVMAMAIRGSKNGRPVCDVGFVDLKTGKTMGPMQTYSDIPDGMTVLNEASDCGVAPLGDGFLVLWTQIVSNTSNEGRLFAQRLTGNGTNLGERLVLASGETKRLNQPTVVGLKRDTAVVGLAGKLIYVAADGSLRESVRQAQQNVVMGSARGHLFVRSDLGLSVLGPDEKPVGPDFDTLDPNVAPFGDGFILPEKGMFPAVKAYSATLTQSTSPVGLGDDRQGGVVYLMYDPAGTHVAALVRNNGQLSFRELTCSTTQAPMPGLAPCAAGVPGEKFDLGCSDPVCHTIIRLDYLTLAPRGYAVVGGPLKATSADEARVAAKTVFSKDRYISDQFSTSEPKAGLYYNYASPGDFGGFALVSADSGVVVVAGGIVWSGRGSYWSPTTWGAASNVTCGESPAVASEIHLNKSDCPLEDEEGKTVMLPTALQALQLGLRTNLAAAVAEKGPFKAYLYAYTPSVGVCNPRVAEYLVVLSPVVEP